MIKRQGTRNDERDRGGKGEENKTRHNKIVWKLHKLGDRTSEQEVITKLSLEISMGGYSHPATLRVSSLD